MQRVTRDKLTPVFDRRLPPVLRVGRGEVFVVETEDSRGGRTRVPEHTTPEFLLAMRKQGYYGNPVTGPIFTTLPTGSYLSLGQVVKLHTTNPELFAWCR